MEVWTGESDIAQPVASVDGVSDPPALLVRLPCLWGEGATPMGRGRNRFSSSARLTDDGSQTYTGFEKEVSMSRKAKAIRSLAVVRCPDYK